MKKAVVKDIVFAISWFIIGSFPAVLAKITMTAAWSQVLTPYLIMLGIYQGTQSVVAYFTQTQGHKKEVEELSSKKSTSSSGS